MARPGGLLLAALAAVVLGAAAWVLQSGRRPPRADRPDPPRSAEEVVRAPREPPEAVPRQDWEESLAPEGAAGLRRLLREDPMALAEAGAALLAEGTPRDVRMALALVMGTLPGTAQDPILLEALDRFAEDPGVVRCILFALGGTRDPPEDDDVFDLGDRPWGVHGPGGIGITVRRAIEDPRVRQAVGERMRAAEPAVREAAATALRHTLDAPDVRTEFVAALGGEAQDDVALVLGESLAVWASGAEDDSERGNVVTLLLSRAPDAALDGLRFRMEDDFRRIPLTASHRATLRDYAHPARPFELRSFALAVLCGSATRSGEAAVQESRDLLERFVGADADPRVRDASARLLGTLPESPSTIGSLVAAARSDAAWNVRYQAVEALAGFAKDPDALAALRAAAEDRDERVAARAREILAR